VVFSSSKLINRHFDHLPESVRQFCSALSFRTTAADIRKIVDGFEKLRVLVVGDTADGGIRGQVRLAGSFWASPIVVGDTLVAVNTEGKTFLVAVADKPEIVAENELPGTFTASPAVADGSLYLRSETALWKVALAK
jgi:hypothetical protein